MRKPLVIITGASSGIGAVTARLFSHAGYSVGLIARNLVAMQELNLPNSICRSADVADYDALKTAIVSIEKELGATDCLVNNAGFVKAGEFTEINHHDRDAMVNTNLVGAMHAMEIVLPGMRQRKNGTIINISSLADRSPIPVIATYAATKAALKSLSESLRAANAKYNVRICNLAPALIATPMLSAANLNQDHVIDPEAFAKTILWIYEQPQNICIRDMVVAPTQHES